ncbi:acyltransferase-domain-containing protein, partial [Eremomyces bilateralis CBS 781.70]
MANLLAPLVVFLTLSLLIIALLHLLSFITNAMSRRLDPSPSPTHSNGSLSKRPSPELPPIVHSDPFKFYAGLLTSLLLLIVAASYGAISSILLRLFGLGGLSQWTTARAFKWMMGLSTGIWFEVLNANGGKEVREDGKGDDWLNGTRPAVFLGNHQSELDILMLGAMFPKYCSVTSKRSLMWYPFLGWFMALSKTVFIDRANRQSAIAAFDGAAHTMRVHRQSVFIFPEGTRSYPDHAMLLPFKKGAFHLAVQAQVPIVPVAVANYANVVDVRRQIFRAGRIPVRVMEPVETRGLGQEDVGALMERVREGMLREIEELTRL